MSEPRALVTGTDRAATWAGTLAAIGFVALASFQTALAAGAPWGVRRLGWRKRGPVRRSAKRKRSRRRR
jgi:hypothetical protein